MLQTQPRNGRLVRFRLNAWRRPDGGSGRGETRLPGQAVSPVRFVAQCKNGVSHGAGGCSVRREPSDRQEPSVRRAGALARAIEHGGIVMSLLTGFFKESDTQLGVFY